MLNLDKNKKYLLACSFGPDSMCLLYMLYKEGYNFGVAHVNYHFRKESDDEEARLSIYCMDRRIPFYRYENYEKVRSNLEEKAREIRYNFFKTIYDKDGYDALLVAHHKDDHLETYLLQKQRKNLPIFYGIQGEANLFGMVVIRPLLDMYKEDIMSYNKEHNVPYSIDYTNLENTYQRNKIRNQYLSKLNKEEKEQLLREIAEKNNRLEIIKCKLNDNDINSVEFLLSLSLEELAYGLNMLIKKELPNYECSLRFVEEVKKVCLSEKSNIVIPLRKGYLLCKEYDRLNVRCFKSFSPIVIEKPCLIDNELFYFDLEKVGSQKGINQYPLTIRPYEKGDAYQIKDYSVPINRLYIDWKMPLYLRKIWPVFVHDDKIIYIPRYQRNFEMKNDQYFFVKYGFTLKK